MAIDQSRRTVGIHVGPRVRISRLAKHSQLPRVRPSARAQALPRSRQQAESLGMDKLTRHIDRVGARVIRHIDGAEANFASKLQQSEARFVDKLQQKDQIDLQRFEATKVGWSKFILKRCAETVGNIMLRNAPLIIGMLLSVDIAVGTGGVAGLCISVAAVVAVALVVLLWETYRAVREYRAAKAKAAADAGAPAIDAGTASGADTATGASATGTTAPAPGAATHTAAAPQASRRRTLRQRWGAWREQWVDFGRFVLRRGIR